jgi:hypothetical protein
MQRLHLAAVLAVAAFFPVAGATAGPSGSSHPHFDDSGTLPWSSSLAAAQSAARAQGKLIFVEYGRLQCRNCRILVQKVLPTPCLKDRMRNACVGLATDCDQPEARVAAILEKNLPGASVLPLVGFMTADLQWITGWAGGASADCVQGHLCKAETFLAASCRKPAPPAPAPAPKVPGATLASAPAPGTPDRATVEKAHANLEKARQAAATGRWGEVVRLHAEADKAPVRFDTTEWKALAAKAKAWCEETLAAALAAAKDGRTEEAARLCAAVKKEIACEHESVADAARGETAIARLKDVRDAGDDALLRDATRKAAVVEFQGSRWAVLFQ